MINIILNEWKRLLRNRMFIDLTIFFTLSLVIVVSFSVNQNLNQEEYRSKAQKHVRNQWDNLEAMNPHRAAHYGSYAFKPINILKVPVVFHKPVELPNATLQLPVVKSYKDCWPSATLALAVVDLRIAR